MKNKKLEDRLRESIDLESRDFLEEFLACPVGVEDEEEGLYDYPEERKGRPWVFGTVSFCVICLVVGITFFTTNGNGKKPGVVPPIIDNIMFNTFDYDKGENISSSGDDYRELVQKDSDFLYINTQFNLELDEKLFHLYDIDTFCFEIEQTGLLSHCNINLLYKENSKLQFRIGVKKQEYPLFNDEKIEDMWEKQKQFSTLDKSTIHSQELVLVNNTMNTFTNYRTKFMLNNIGIAIDGYDVEQEEFVDIVKTVIDSF